MDKPNVSNVSNKDTPTELSLDDINWHKSQKEMQILCVF